MNNNLDLMSDTFTGRTIVQQQSDKDARADDMKNLDWQIRNILGQDVGLSEVFPYARTTENPWQFFAELLIDLGELQDHCGRYDAQWENFVQRIAEFEQTISRTSAEDRMDRTLDQYEDDLTFVPGTDEDPWVTENLADAVAEGEYIPAPELTVGSKEWGFYNDASTTAYAHSLMRMVWRGQDLYIGAMRVNTNGECACRVSGCKWNMQLSNDVTADGSWDREWAEYQVLAILAHLGSHSRNNARNYWNPINNVSLYRDDALTKLDNASSLQSLLGNTVRVQLIKQSRS